MGAPALAPHDDAADLDAQTTDPNFALTPALAAGLDRLARAAQRDPAARNRLYWLLFGKIERFLGPLWSRAAALGDRDDLRQEAFIVFADLVAGWSGGGSFGPYFFGFYPWRLRHALEARELRWSQRQVALSPERLGELSDARQERDWLSADDAVLLDLGALPPDERTLLTLRIMEGCSMTEAAARLGWSRRTSYRRWTALLARLRQSA